MQYKIEGGTTPVLSVQLMPGEQLVAESGELAWIHGPVQLQTSRSAGMSKGFFKATRRAASGGTFFMTTYSVENGEGSVTFAAKAPGEIRQLDLGDGQEYVVHRGGFVCCESGVELNIHMQKKLGAGVFGGAGFILERLSGTGTAFVELMATWSNTS